MLVVDENTRFAPERAMRLPGRPVMVRQWREARAYEAEGLLHDIAAAAQLINVFLARLLHLMVRARGYRRLGYVSFGSYVRQGLRQQGLRRFEYLVAIQRAISEAQGRPELEQLARDWPRGRVTVTQARHIIGVARGGDPPPEPGRDTATVDDERWERRRFSATQAQHTAWLGFLEICQRVEGADLPVAQCVDDLLAEFSSTLPLDSDVPAGLPPEEKTEAYRAARVMRDAAELLGEIRRAGGGVRLAADPLDGVENGASLDAADLDRRIRWLLRLEGNIAWHQCRLLYIMARLDLHRRLGFRSLAAYAREALDCSPAALASQLSLARRLELLPRVADAFRAGLITALEAAEICKVAVASTQSGWIDRARTSTLRVLQDDVAMVLAQGVEGGAPPQRARAGTELCAWQAAPRPGCRQEIQTSAVRSCPIAIMPLDLGDLFADSGPKRAVAFSAPASVCRVWDITLRRIRDVVGADVRDGQCVAFMLADFLRAWMPRDSRNNGVMVRDGWRCQAPGCAARAHLHAHHVIFRSRGGPDDAWNLVTVCLKHHALIHAGVISVNGRADRRFEWEMGINAAGRPRERFAGGLRVWADPYWSAAGPMPATAAPDDWRQTSWVLQRS